MINSRILNMTNTATNMLNTNILDVLSNMNSSNIHANISIVKQFRIRHAYRMVVEEVAVDADRFTASRAAVMLLMMTGRRRRPVVEAVVRVGSFPQPAACRDETDGRRRRRRSAHERAFLFSHAYQVLAQLTI